jgi:hypothetical protein
VAQHDYIISNQSGAAFRSDVNGALAAIATNNDADTGSAEPSPAYRFQWWADSVTGLLKIRNSGNNAWITVGTLADANLGLLPVAGGTLTGNLTLNAQSDLRLADADSSNWVALHAPATVAANITLTAPSTLGTADQSLVTDAAGVLSFASRSRLVSGTAVVSTSGTSIDFTGIPSWVKKVTVMFNAVSLSGSSNIQIQIGSGSVTTTGYSSFGAVAGATNLAVGVSSTTGFIGYAAAASNLLSASCAITLITGTTYTAAFAGGVNSSGNYYSFASGGGSPSLSGALDRVRITTVNGTDTFDGGTVNILYED